MWGLPETSSAGGREKQAFPDLAVFRKGFSLLAFKMVITQNSVDLQGIKDYGSRLSIPPKKEDFDIVLAEDYIGV